MVAVTEQKQSLACARCGHPVTVERVRDTVVVRSARVGRTQVLVFHLEHLTQVESKVNT